MADKKNWREVHKAEATDFVKKYYQTSWNWRNQGYHDKWDKYDRNASNIYDPTVKSKKKPWQATMFIPSTLTNLEMGTSALSRTLLGRKDPVAFEPREMGDELQAELHNKILQYELEEANFSIAFYDAIKEACKYGSGFVKIYYEKKFAKQRIKEPVREGFMEAFARFRMPQKVGEKEVIQDVLVKDGVRCETIHIRDIFLEPNSTDLQRVLHRNKNITYSELKQMADEGLYDKDSVEELAGIREPDNFEVDVQPLKSEENITDPQLIRPDWDKRHTIWEYWGPIPRKWIDLEMSEDSDSAKAKANEIVPGKITIASGQFYLESSENPTQFMEPPFVQIDYIRRGDTYGLGICQVMEGLQEEINEIRNLRVDNVNLIMNKIFLAIEKYLVDPNELESKPGGVIRLKGSEIDDVRKVVAELAISDAPLSAFRETAELERQIQEATGINRVTLGTAGMVRDTNATLGGMQLLQQNAQDRFMFYAYVIAKASMRRAAKMIMSLSYQNRDDGSIQRIIGMMPVTIINQETGQIETVAKWKAFKKMPPHELEKDYDLVPTDVFSAQNKAERRQAITSFMQLASSVLPGMNPRPGMEKLGKYSDFSSEEVLEILGPDRGQMPTPMGMGQGVPSMARPSSKGPAGMANSPQTEQPPLPTGPNPNAMMG